jgi:hypothetical protein
VLLKIEISSIVHCCFSLSQNELKFLLRFREEDLNVKVYDIRRTDDGRQLMAKAHMAFGQVS